MNMKEDYEAEKKEKQKIETIYKKLYHSFCNAQTYNGYMVGRELE